MRTVTGPTDRSSWSAPASAVWPARCTWPAPAGRSPCSSGSRSPAAGPGRLSRRRLRVRHRADRAHHARPDRRGARRGRREARRLARPRRRSTPPTARTTRTGPRSTSSPTPCGWPPRSPGSAGRARPTATCGSSTTPAGCGSSSAPTSSTRNFDAPTDLLTAQPGPAARARARSGGSRRRSTSSSAIRVPAGSSPSRRCTPASRRTTRWPSTRSSPTSTPSPASTSRAAASTPCRGRWPARPRSTACEIRYGTTVTAGRDRRTAAPPPCITADGERMPGRRRRAQPRPAGRLPRPAARVPPAAQAALLALLRGAAHRIEPARYEKIAHHNIHFGRAWTGTFDEVIRPRRADERPVAAGDQPQPHRSRGGAGRPADLLRARARAQPRHGRRSTGAATSAQRLRRRARSGTLEERGYVGFADGVEVRQVVTPADWADAGMAAGTPFAAAHSLFQTGPFRPGNLHRDTVQCGLRRLGHPTRRRRAHGADLRQARRRPVVGGLTVTALARTAPGRARRRRRAAGRRDDGRRGAHRRPGQLHRAFSVLLTRPDRAGCCCSAAPREDPLPAALGQHLLRPPRAGRGRWPIAANRRLREEIGARAGRADRGGRLRLLRRGPGDRAGRVRIRPRAATAGSTGERAAAARPGRGGRADLGRPRRAASSRCAPSPRSYSPWLAGA